MSNEGINRVQLLGNLGSDPELRTTAGGQSVLTFRLATSEVFFDKDKVKQERTEWHTVTVWGKRAEALAKWLTKGSRVYLDGRIHNSTYEKDGQKRYKSEIVVNDLVFLGGGARREERSRTDPPPNGAFLRAPEASFADAELPF
jgi:single-strand DNA-binding protein